MFTIRRTPTASTSSVVYVVEDEYEFNERPVNLPSAVCLRESLMYKGLLVN